MTINIPVSVSSRYDALTDNQKLACRALIVAGCIGFIVIVVYYLPVWDILTIFAVFFMIPALFFLAIGLIGRETFNGLMALLNMSRADVAQTVEAAKEVKAKTK